MFDRRKYINYETLALFQRVFLEGFNSLNVPIHIIAGNHDVYYRNTNKLCSLNLLINKKCFENFNVYNDIAEEVIIDNRSVVMLPWINGENYQASYEVLDKSLATEVFSHLEMKGFEYHKGILSDRGHFDEDFLSKFVNVFSGHYHTRASRNNIKYVGTPWETSWNDFGEQKGVHLYSDTGLEFIPNTDRVFHRIVYDDRQSPQFSDFESLENKFVKIVIKSKANPFTFEEFVSSIETAKPYDLNIVDESNSLKEVSESTEIECAEIKDTMSVIQSFLEQELETSLDKNVLLKNLTNMYLNALEMTNED